MSRLCLRASHNISASHLVQARPREDVCNSLELKQDESSLRPALGMNMLHVHSAPSVERVVELQTNSQPAA
jgi:hypothetical protein